MLTAIGGAFLLLPLPYSLLGIVSIFRVPAAVALLTIGIVLWVRKAPAAPPVAGPRNAWTRVPSSVRLLLKVYLVILAGALLAVALLFVVNIFAPLGIALVGRVGGTFLSLTLGWGWGLLSVLMLGVRPIRPAGAVGLATGVAIIVFGSLAVWDFTGTYDLHQVWQGLLLLQAYTLIGAGAWALVDRDLQNVAAWACVATTYGAGLVVGTGHVLEGTPSALEARFVTAASQVGMALAVASVSLFTPPLPALRSSRWYWFAAPLPLAAAALTVALLPASDRMGSASMGFRIWLAAWVVSAVLALVGLTVWMLARLRAPRLQAVTT